MKTILFISTYFLINPLLLRGQATYSDSLEISQDSIIKEIGKTKQEHAAFYWEFGGNAGVMSMNLDLRYWRDFAFRAGLGWLVSSSTEGDLNEIVAHPDIAVMASYLFFHSEFHVEAGIGTMIDLSKHYSDGILPSNNTRFTPTAVLGLRYQSYVGSYIARLGFTPFFNATEFRNWFGFSFGYCFY